MKIGIFAIVAVFVIAIVTVGAYAFGPRNEAMQDALESGDYDAYIGAVDGNDKPYLKHKLTEEQFQKRVEQYAEQRVERESSQEAMRTAMEQGYDAWRVVVNSMDPMPRIPEVITEDNFEAFVAMHNAKMAGDFETAKALAEELGISPKGHGHGLGGRQKSIGCRLGTT